MTLQREGWIDGGPKVGSRPFAVVRDQNGRAQKYICLKCQTETEPDGAVFAKHLCQTKKNGS